MSIPLSDNIKYFNDTSDSMSLLNIFINSKFYQSFEPSSPRSIFSVIDDLSSLNIPNSLIIFTLSDNMIIAINIYDSTNKFNYLYFTQSFWFRVRNIYIFDDPSLISSVSSSISHINQLSSIINSDITKQLLYYQSVPITHETLRLELQKLLINI